MTISSRTPEGSPWRCPMCGAEVRMEPCWPSGDATCPHCGTLLWPERLHRSTAVRSHRWLLKAVPVLGLLLICISIAVLLGLLLALRQLFGLGLPEILALAILGILFFGRKLPDIAHYLGRRIGSRYL